MDQALYDELEQLLGARHVRREPSELAVFGRDRTTLWEAAPAVAVFPADTAEVQALVSFANHHQVAVVPSGGRTGLSGGAVAANGEMVIALDRMNRILDFNEVDRTLRVEAGVLTANLQQFAIEKGLFYPVDFASAGSSQIGGNIATNAGGIKVIRYGMTREQIVGLEVVTGAGQVLELNRGLMKNNSGLDLRHLFIGSEGLLGLITAATIRLQSAPEPASVMVLGVNDFDGVLKVLQLFNAACTLSAFEFFSENALHEVIAHTGLQRPFGTAAPFYALLEFDASSEPQAMALFEHATEQAWVCDGVVSRSLSQARDLWRLREDISETLSHKKPYKNDISVRVSRLPGFINDVESLVATLPGGMQVVWYGHIGDGNMHLNILPGEQQSAEDFLAVCGEFSGRLAGLLQQYEGSISAEHGVGLLKKAYLWSTRSAEEIALMKQLKAVFDPAGILNPGKVFDP